MKEIIKEVIQNIENRKPSKTIKFSNKNYKPIEISSKYFHKIEPQQGSISFIDGGNAELIKTPSLSLHFIRVVGVTYKNNKREQILKEEFYSLTTAFNNNNEIFYKTKLFNNNLIDEGDLVFNSLDPNLTQGKSRASISIIGEIARKFAELELADKLNSEMIVLDNSLECKFPNEEKYFNKLFQKKSLITGLNKTTTLFTDTGDSITNTLKTNLSKWFYYPIVEINNEKHKAEMCFVKLHEKSDYIFRFELFNKQKEHLKKAINILSSQCNDPVFLGYPHGLIMADRLARIGNKEQNFLITKFIAGAGDSINKLKPYIKALDAHEILDNIG